MVRPIEISDFLSKAQEVGRMQQNAEMRPEAAQDFQKALSDKLNIQQVNSPNPTPETDHVVLHVDEQEKEKRKTDEDQESELEKQDEEKHGDLSRQKQMKNSEEDNDNPSDHIDIKV